jgi:D-tyrosyl-tRNA(Tyr) deacylase
MKAVVQRVKHAHVNIDGQTVGACEHGLMVLLGVAADDDEVDAQLLCQKLCKLRIFCDENDKMNLSIHDIGGQMLVVSQFTLLADTSHGNRPSFIGAGDPSHANALYERFVAMVRAEGIPVQTGSFGASMEVTIVNDGPVTILMDSTDYRRGNLKK